MASSPQSIRIPAALDAEVDRFVEDTGIYASKSEFIREAVRAHLQDLHTDAGILALRLRQAMARAEHPSDDHDQRAVDAIVDEIDDEAVEAALQAAEEEVAAAVLGDQADDE